jgi:phospholipid/cholesterol/gamma-HCH transport system substrate-binding protein
MKFSKEFKIGLLALISGTVLYLGFNFLKGQDFFSNTNKYFVWYDRVDGLTVSNSVSLNGLSIGRVESTTLVQERGNKILVEIQVNEEILLGDSTRAIISSQSLVGGKYINLVLGPNSKVYENGDTLRGELEKGFAQVIADKATPVIDHLDTTIYRVNQMLSKENNENLTKSIRNVAAISASAKKVIDNNSQNIEGITTNINTLTASLVETEKSLRPIIAKMNSIADTLNDLELKQTISKANAMLDNLSSITGKINSGQGSLGALINDRKTVDSLNKAMAEVTSLVQEFKTNPRFFLKPLGSKPKKNKKSSQ